MDGYFSLAIVLTIKSFPNTTILSSRCFVLVDDWFPIELLKAFLPGISSCRRRPRQQACGTFSSLWRPTQKQSLGPDSQIWSMHTSARSWASPHLPPRSSTAAPPTPAIWRY